VTETPHGRLGVERYAGYRGEETPRRFTLGGRKVQVVAVVERWREPRWRGFRVRGDDGRENRLRQAVGSGRWELMGTD
jgi:hypothetical protein